MRVVNSKDDMKGSYLGTDFTQEEIEKELKSIGAHYEIFDYDQLIDKTAQFLSEEKLSDGFKEEWNLVQELWGKIYFRRS